MLNRGSHLMRDSRIERDGREVSVGTYGVAPGTAGLQLAGRLAFSTVEGREKIIRAFARHCDALPWAWTPQLVDDWMTDLRAVRGLRRSTLRGYQIALSQFCRYVTDPAYGWPDECEAR